MRRRIRVVSCVDSMFIGGTELNAVRTAEHLDRDRFALSVACLSEAGPLRERYESADIPVEVFPIRALYDPRNVRQGIRFGRYLRREGVQVVHAHDVYSNIFFAVWARLFGVPVVIASRRWWDQVPRRALMNANRLAYRFAHRVLANSEAVAGLLTETEGVDPARIVVIPNFVDDSMFESRDTTVRRNIRAEFGYSDHDVVVGSVARLHPVKDLMSLLRAVHSLAGKRPALRLLFVGDGECRGALERETMTLGLTDRVRFAGMRPHAPNMHAALDISVCCSLSEGFPNSVVEAMAAGRPVVATRVGGIPDAVDHGRTGYLVAPRDPAGLAAAIDSLVVDPTLRARLGGAGRDVARARYRMRGVLDRLETTYERLVDEAQESSVAPASSTERATLS